MNKLSMAALLAGFLFITGCGGGEQKPKAGVTTAPCILCAGHEIEVTPATLSSEHEGKRYYFCGDSCKKAFDADPAKAVAQHAGK